MNPSTSWATTDLLVGLGPAGLDHCGVDPRIYWRFQLGVRRGLYKRVLSHLQGFQCLGGCCHPQTRRCFQGDQIQNSFCEKFTRKLIYLAADLFLPNSPRSSLHPNNTTRINERMTALPNAKSTLSIAIDTVTRPYADAAATTQETVSRVSSSNLSSIDYDGELLVSSCSGRFS